MNDLLWPLLPLMIVGGLALIAGALTVVAFVGLAVWEAVLDLHRWVINELSRWSQLRKEKSLTTVDDSSNGLLISNNQNSSPSASEDNKEDKNKPEMIDQAPFRDESEQSSFDSESSSLTQENASDCTREKDLSNAQLSQAEISAEKSNQAAVTRASDSFNGLHLSNNQNLSPSASEDNKEDKNKPEMTDEASIHNESAQLAASSASESAGNMAKVREIVDSDLRLIAFNSVDLSVAGLREEFDVKGATGCIVNYSYIIGIVVEDEFVINHSNFPGDKAVIEREMLFDFLKQRFKQVRYNIDLMRKMDQVKRLIAQRDSFLEAILQSPDDDSIRLIYADWLEECGVDWLEECGHPRGEFIRVQCELTRLPGQSSRRQELENRERELLESFRREWDRVDGVGYCKTRYRRGFIEEIEIQAKDFLAKADSLFKRSPINNVCLTEAWRYLGGDLEVIATIQHLLDTGDWFHCSSPPSDQ